MFGYHVVVGYFADHLNVILLLPLGKLRLQHHKKVVTVLILVGGSLCKGRHLS